MRNDRGNGGLATRIDDGVRTLSPVYFALVMATGVISLGLDLEGFHAASIVLFSIAALAYAIILVMTVWRVLRHRDAFVADLANPATAFGFFTFVAGTNVLAARATAQAWHGMALALLVLAGASWLILGYVVPWMAALGRATHPVLPRANGSWFIWVVASQSVAVTTASLEPDFRWARDAFAAFAVLGWAVGIFLYGIVGVCVVMRMLLYDVRAADLGHPYWVTMGAAAITVLAGAMIVDMDASPVVDSVRALVAGSSVLFWAFATWLIPALVAVDWWRHVRRRLPLSYEPGLWGMVFPLGMYAVAGLYLGHADRLPLAGRIGDVALWVALAVWLVVFVAMLRRLGSRLFAAVT